MAKSGMENATVPGKSGMENATVPGKSGMENATVPGKSGMENASQQNINNQSTDTTAWKGRYTTSS
ncbi:MAG: hypothetical protein FWH47_00045 [Methanomassiliicoccaceae archaeon]|nr:hypothetical protein [Methanomassiliicoccaceae archaeon]